MTKDFNGAYGQAQMQYMQAYWCTYDTTATFRFHWVRYEKYFQSLPEDQAHKINNHN